MKKCPYCAEMIQDDAIVCRYCGNKQPQASTPRTPPPYNGDSGSNAGYNNGNYVVNDAWERNDAFASGPEGRSRGVAAIFALLLGSIGLQYFYVGKITGGLLTILLTIVTCGLWGLVMFIQGIVMFCISNQEFRNKFVISNSSFPVF